MKKIVLTGPESSGKSTLARQLAEYYQTLWVPEYARKYLEERGGAYEKEDLIEIAKGQLYGEKIAWASALLEPDRGADLIFCDTGILVIKIWSEFKYGTLDLQLLKMFQNTSYDLYLLCGIDLPWEPDPLRENPNERAELYDVYRRELQNMYVPFFEIKGKREERLQQAIKLVDLFLSKNQ